MIQLSSTGLLLEPMFLVLLRVGAVYKNTKYNNFNINPGLPSFMSIVTIILLVISGIETIPGPQCKVVASLDPLPSVQDITSAVTCLLRLLERGKTVVTGHNNLRYTNI